MGILLDVAKELLGMFIADLRLTLSTVALILITAALSTFAHLGPAICGFVLIAGTIAVLVEASMREAARRRR